MKQFSAKVKCLDRYTGFIVNEVKKEKEKKNWNSDINEINNKNEELWQKVKQNKNTAAPTGPHYISSPCATPHILA